MKKQYILGLLLVIFIVIGIYCFFNIPRINYQYDEVNNYYYVDKVYGNAKSYTIKGEINGISVKKIGDRAFKDLDNLEEVIFENKDELVYIGRLSFSGCNNLVNIDLSKVEEIGNNAFEECSSLKSVVLNVKHILGSTFYDCINLENVILNGTYSIGSFAFANTNIKKLIIPSSIKYIYIDAFAYMNNIEEILIYSNIVDDKQYIESCDFCKFV